MGLQAHGLGLGVVMVLGMLAFWVLVTLAVVWLIRTTGRPQPPSEPEDDSDRSAAITRSA